MLAPGALEAALAEGEFCPLTGSLLGAPPAVEASLRAWRGADPHALPKPELKQSRAVLKWLGKKKRVSGSTLAALFGAEAETWGWKGETGESLAGEKLLVLLNAPNGTPRDQCEVNREACDALLSSEFTRGGKFVEVAGGQISPMLATGVVRDRLTRHVVFGRYESSDSGWVLQKVDPPEFCTAFLAGAHQVGAMPLEALLRHPTLLPSGELILQPGYYFGLLLQQAQPFIQLELAQAAALLTEPFRDFNFERDEGRAVALAGVLTLFARPMLWLEHASSPGFVFDAAERGTGKTLLTNCVLGCAGLPPSDQLQIPWSDSEEELMKRVDSALFAGDPALVFDNARNGAKFGSPTLDSWLTSKRHVRARVLGESLLKPMPWLCTVFVNGNQISLAEDSVRRFMRARIKKPKALTRSQEALEALVVRAQPVLASAALTLLSAHLRAGAGGSRQLASFDRWSSVVAGCVERFYGRNPIECQDSTEDLDVSTSELADAVASLAAAIGCGIEMKIDQLATRAGSPLFALYQAVFPQSTARAEQVKDRGYAQALARVRGRTFGELIVHWRIVSGVRLWSVQPVGKPLPESTKDTP